MLFKFDIQKLKLADYNEHANLLEQLTETKPITKENYINILKQPHISIFLCKDLETKKIVGTISVLIEQKLIHSGGTVAHIEDIVVDKEYRGMGIGKKLLTYAIDFSKLNNCYKIILNCKPDLEEFYQKVGFECKNIQMSIYL